MKPARGSGIRQAGKEGQGKGKATTTCASGLHHAATWNFDWISASKLNFHCPSAVGPESVAVQLRANPGPFAPPNTTSSGTVRTCSIHTPHSSSEIQNSKPPLGEMEFEPCRSWSSSRVTPQATHSSHPLSPRPALQPCRVETQILTAQATLRLPPTTLHCRTDK